MNREERGPILVLAGTVEGRQIAVGLFQKGYPVLASVTSSLGADILARECAVPVRVGHLVGESLGHLLDERGVELVIDATHPYAETVTSMAEEICREKGITYFRFQRPATSWPDYKEIIFTPGYEEAAGAAVQRGPVLFLAVGSKNLPVFIRKAREAGVDFYVRILAVEESLEHCRQLGIAEDRIIAARGPYTREENEKMLRQTGASVLVTKDSGASGGTAEKVEAAINLGITVIVVGRPKRPVAECPDGYIYDNINDLIGRVKEVWNRQ